MTEQNLLSEHEVYDDQRQLEDGELQEVELEIYTQSWDGGQSKNVDIRAREDNGTRGLKVGEYIDVEKEFAETIETHSTPKYSLHKATVNYKGEEVQITMYGNDARRFNEAGGEGDTVRIRKRKIWDEANERGYSRYEFIKQD
jgi:hypothetical protein